MREAAWVGVRPATGTSPIIGKRIVPRSLTRASVVRSGLRKTLTRTMSPMPSASSRSSAAGVASGAEEAGIAAASEGWVTLREAV